MPNLIVNELKRYTVEALYQWDKDQELVIRGLNIPDPEIHFTNEALVRTIPGEFSVDTTDVITVCVPNSLLQQPYAINVYVCGYEGKTFKTYHKIRIPVKSRPRPADYTLELTDGEVYSFDSLSKRVADLEATVGTDTKATYYHYTVNGSGDALTEGTKTTTIAGYAPFISQSLKAIKSVFDKLKNDLTRSINAVSEKHTTDMTTVNESLSSMQTYVIQGINEAKNSLPEWNIDRAVGRINEETTSIFVNSGTSSSMRESINSNAIYMINSGTIYVKFKLYYYEQYLNGSTKDTSLVAKVFITNGENIVYERELQTLTNKANYQINEDIIIPVTVHKGDYLIFTTSLVTTSTANHILRVDSVDLLANVETPSKYHTLTDLFDTDVTEPTTAEVLNTLLGEE